MSEITQVPSPTSLEGVVSNHNEHVEGIKRLDNDAMSVDSGLEVVSLSEGLIVSGNKNVPEAWGDTTGNKND